jgi:hypothetical protein
VSSTPAASERHPANRRRRRRRQCCSSSPGCCGEGCCCSPRDARSRGGRSAVPRSRLRDARPGGAPPRRGADPRTGPTAAPTPVASDHRPHPRCKHGCAGDLPPARTTGRAAQRRRRRAARRLGRARASPRLSTGPVLMEKQGLRPQGSGRRSCWCPAERRPGSPVLASMTPGNMPRSNATRIARTTVPGAARRARRAPVRAGRPRGFSRAAAAPPPIAWPVPDRSSHAVALVDTTTHSRGEVQALAGSGLARANADGRPDGVQPGGRTAPILRSRSVPAGGARACRPAHQGFYWLRTRARR